MEVMNTTLADGTTIDLIPRGCRVRHISQHDLTGEIEGYEHCRDGVLSAIPYRIRWDDPSEAHRRLGMFYFYGCGDSVERLNALEVFP
jgi:hypothetical protein